MRKEEIPLQKVTLSLYEGDFDRLREFKPRLGASKVVRILVRKYINEVEAQTSARTGAYALGAGELIELTGIELTGIDGS